MKTFLRSLAVALLVLPAAMAPVLAKGSGTASQSATPSSSSTSTSSSTTASGSTASIESQFLAFQAMGKLANNVEKDICSKIKASGATIVIFDQASFANILAYESFAANADAITAAYDNLTASAPGSASATPTPPPSGSTRHAALITTPVSLSDATGLLTLLASSSNSQTPGSVTIPDAAAALSVIHAFDGCAAVSAVVYPPLPDPNLSGHSDAVTTKIAEVNAARLSAYGKIPLGSNMGSSSTGTTYLAAQMTDINALYDALINSLSQSNSSTGAPNGASIVQGGQLFNLLAVKAKTKPVYVLLATVLAAGGTTEDHKSFWTNLTSGDIFKYSGGTVLGVAFWKVSADGDPLRPYADVLRYRYDFREGDDVENSFRDDPAAAETR